MAYRSAATTKDAVYAISEVSNLGVTTRTVTGPGGFAAIFCLSTARTASVMTLAMSSVFIVRLPYPRDATDVRDKPGTDVRVSFAFHTATPVPFGPKEDHPYGGANQ